MKRTTNPRKNNFENIVYHLKSKNEGCFVKDNFQSRPLQSFPASSQPCQTKPNQIKLVGGLNHANEPFGWRPHARMQFATTLPCNLPALYGCPSACLLFPPDAGSKKVSRSYCLLEVQKLLAREFAGHGHHISLKVNLTSTVV